MNKVRSVAVALLLLPVLSAVAQTDTAPAPEEKSVSVPASRTPACPIQGLPSKVLIQYEASATRSGLSLEGEAVLEFVRSGNDYTLTTTLTAAGVQWAQQTSQGTVTAGALRTARYGESRLRRSESSALFDWQAQKVMFPDGTEAALHEGVQDRLSALLSLSQQQRAQPGAEAVDFAVASLRRISPYHFVRREAATLELPEPLGAVQAVRYEHVDSDGDRLEVWLAPERCALPVRVRSRDHRGQDIDQRARAVVVE